METTTQKHTKRSKRKQRANGRKPDPKSLSGRARTLLNKGASVEEVCAVLGCTRPFVYGVQYRMRVAQGLAKKYKPRATKAKVDVAAPASAPVKPPRILTLGERLRVLFTGVVA